MITQRISHHVTHPMIPHSSRSSYGAARLVALLMVLILPLAFLSSLRAHAFGSPTSAASIAAAAPQPPRAAAQLASLASDVGVVSAIRSHGLSRYASEVFTAAPAVAPEPFGRGVWRRQRAAFARRLLARRLLARPDSAYLAVSVRAAVSTVHFASRTRRS